MREVYKVICSNKGSCVCSSSFKDFDSAFKYAEDNHDKGCVSLILQLDFETLKWKRRLVLYPSNCC